MLTLRDAAEVLPPPEKRLMNVMNDIFAEVYRQDKLAREGKFGGKHILPSGPDEARLPVLLEEVGEVARELNEITSCRNRDEHMGKLYAELVQVAACAMVWAATVEIDGD